MKDIDYNVINEKPILSREKKNEYLNDTLNIEIGVGRPIEYPEFQPVPKRIIRTQEKYELVDLKEYLKEKEPSETAELQDKNNMGLIDREFNYLEQVNKRYYDKKLQEVKKQNESQEDSIEEMFNELEETKVKDTKIQETNGKLINSFYTRSMDLSKDDFLNMLESEHQKKQSKTKVLGWFIILSILVVLLVLLLLYVFRVIR